ncbi:condensation domain-containing protein, partial [Rheinheimera baltica]
MSVINFVGELLVKGIKLELRENELIAKAAKGLLTTNDATYIKQHKNKIIQLLKNTQKGKAEVSGPIAQKREGQDFPLTMQQQSLWYFHKIHPGSFAYNIPLTYELKGDLKVDLLVQCIKHLIQRHESLTTRFIEIDGEPRQRVENNGDFIVPVLTAREEELSNIVLTESEHVFDLFNDRLLRVKLVHLSQSHHVLMINMHHIISDGTSIGIFLHELKELYLHKADNSCLARVEIQYADYSQWQQEQRPSETYFQSKKYWLESLENAPAISLFPTDHIRPNESFNNGNVSKFSIPSNVSESLRNIAKDQSCTLYIVLLAAFKFLLYRHTNQEDLVVGIMAENKRLLELENTIGFFANPLALRSVIDTHLNFNEFLMQVKDTVLNGLEHQEVIFSDIVSGLKFELEPSISPLFQTMFLMDVGAVQSFSLPGINCKGLAQEWQISKFDLSVTMFDNTDKSLAGVFEYNSDIFEQTTIEKIIDNYIRLLANLVASPGQQLGQMEILSPHERQTLLHTWNQTDAPYPMDKTLAQL